jgi:hypothetical protein
VQSLCPAVISRGSSNLDGGRRDGKPFAPEHREREARSGGFMNPKAASATSLEVAPDPVLASESLFVVGLTAEGHVPLLVEAAPGSPVVIRLPGLAGSRPLDPLSALHRRLRDEAGLDADELVVMSRYGIPTGERGRATVLLAPRARVFPSVQPGLRLVPLSELSRWLSRCRHEGIRVDARVWVGLLLAERHFARWAQSRLRAAVDELHRKSPPAETEGASQWTR